MSRVSLAGSVGGGHSDADRTAVLIQSLRAPILRHDLPGCPAPAAGIEDEIWQVAELETTQSISTRFPSYDTLIDMETVTLSPKFQVVIPLSVRKALKLAPGEKLRVFRYGERVEFVPLRPIQELRGFLRGLDTSIEREEDRL